MPGDPRHLLEVKALVKARAQQALRNRIGAMLLDAIEDILKPALAGGHYGRFMTFGQFTKVSLLQRAVSDFATARREFVQQSALVDPVIDHVPRLAELCFETNWVRQTEIDANHLDRVTRLLPKIDPQSRI